MTIKVIQKNLFQLILTSGLLFNFLFSYGQNECKNLVIEYQIGEDGYSYRKTELITVNGSGVNFEIPRKYNSEEYFEYTDPSTFKVRKFGNDPFYKVTFNSSNVKVISNGSFLGDEVERNEIGVFIYETKLNPFGFYWLGDPIVNFQFSWEIPESFTLLDYECNRKGEWMWKENKLIFKSTDVNYVVFKISYGKKDQFSESSVGEGLN